MRHAAPIVFSVLALVLAFAALIAAAQGACYAHWAAFGTHSSWCFLG